jgi:large subunit ribosomal protein L30
MSSDSKTKGQREDSNDKGNSGEQGFIRIQLYRSTIGVDFRQKTLVRSLGLTKLNQVVERPDTAAMRGAVRKAPHLLRIVE